MFSPGAKGWVNKYFDLVQKKELQLDVDWSIVEKVNEDELIHVVLGRTGINFGYATQFIYFNPEKNSKWTSDEKLKLLLFESLLFVYYQKNKSLNIDDFSRKVIEFYEKSTSSNKIKAFFNFSKSTNSSKIESILAKRVDIKVSYFGNSFWVNQLNNAIIYLDVILFKLFLETGSKNIIVKHPDYALDVLKTITLSAYADGVIEKKEKLVFDVFLASANLPENYHEIATERFQEGMNLNHSQIQVQKNILFRKYLIDLAALVILSNQEYSVKEKDFITQYNTFLGLDEETLNDSLALTEQFILNNQDQISFLHDSSSMEKLVGSFSKRWVKILGRNKDKLVVELQQSKELVNLIRKSTKTELTKEEKELVKVQFMDIVKSMPSLAIFMLPGGTILLPLILKIIPDLMPSAFRDNEIDKD